MNKNIFNHGASILGSGFVEIPYGTTSQRGNPNSENAKCGIRVNKETGLIEWWSTDFPDWKNAGEALKINASGAMLSTITAEKEMCYVYTDYSGAVTVNIEDAKFKSGEMFMIAVNEYSQDAARVTLRLRSVGATAVVVNGVNLTSSIAASDRRALVKDVLAHNGIYTFTKVGTAGGTWTMEFSPTYRDYSDFYNLGLLTRYAVSLSSTSTTFLEGNRNNHIQTNVSDTSKIYKIGLSKTDNIREGSRLIISDVEGEGPFNRIVWDDNILDTANGVVPGTPVFTTRYSRLEFVFLDTKWRATNLTVTHEADRLYAFGLSGSGRVPGKIKAPSGQAPADGGLPFLFENNNGALPSEGLYVIESADNTYVRSTLYVQSINAALSRKILARGMTGTENLNFRSVYPITKIWDISWTTAQKRLMPSPKTTVVLNDDITLDIRAMDTLAIHEWELGDIIELINHSDSGNIDFVSVSSGTKPKVFNENNEEIDQNVIGNIRVGRGILRLMWTKVKGQADPCWRVFERVYYN